MNHFWAGFKQTLRSPKAMVSAAGIAVLVTVIWLLNGGLE
jgi:hypothetical protein